jgi:hypothetical protein
VATWSRRPARGEEGPEWHSVLTLNKEKKVGGGTERAVHALIGDLILSMVE